MRSKPFTWALVLVAVLTALAPFAPAVHADELATSDPSGGGEYVDGSKLGTFAAIACGFMVRATIATGGAVVGAIAGAIASCGFMIFLGAIE
jgi:hypothetical protein